jgi:hypothetical protein
VGQHHEGGSDCDLPTEVEDRPIPPNAVGLRTADPHRILDCHRIRVQGDAAARMMAANACRINSQTPINLGDQDNSHFRVQLWTSGGHLKWELDIRNGNRQLLGTTGVASHFRCHIAIP